MSGARQIEKLPFCRYRRSLGYEKSNEKSNALAGAVARPGLLCLKMSGVMITGVVTTAMVGRLGAVALTAVGIATMVQFASAMVIAAFGTGASAIVGKESGAGSVGGSPANNGAGPVDWFVAGPVAGGCRLYRRRPIVPADWRRAGQ